MKQVLKALHAAEPFGCLKLARQLTFAMKIVRFSQVRKIAQNSRTQAFGLAELQLIFPMRKNQPPSVLSPSCRLWQMGASVKLPRKAQGRLNLTGLGLTKTLRRRDIFALVSALYGPTSQNA
jgi:hypothetical protein